MKTNSLLIAVVLALALPATGCNKGNVVVKETKVMPTAAVEFKLKWPVGRHAVQSFDLKQGNEMNVPGAPKPMKQDLTMGQNYSLTVLKELPGGGREIEMEYLDSRMSMTMDGRSMVDFDSTKKSAGSSNAMATVFEKLVGAKVKFILNASNVVESVEGVDEFTARLTSGGGRDPSGILKTMFTQDYFKQMMDQSRNLPGKAVQPGDSWPVQKEIEMGALGALIMDYTFTFDAWEKRNDRWCARLSFAGTTKSKPGQTPGVNGMTMTVENGKSSGTTWFDLDLGMFNLMNLNQDMQMKVTVPNPAAAKKPGSPPTITITTRVNQEINTKLQLK